MLPNVFEEYEVVYVFVASFGCSLSSSIGKRSTLGKISGAAALIPPLQSPPVSTGLQESR